MKYFIISLLIIIHSLIFAQIQWQENGVPVRQGENIDWSGISVSTTDGNLVCVWSDTRNGDRGIFAQKMNPDGVLLWGDEGIEVNDAEKIQDFPVVVSVENNAVIVAWWDNRDEDIPEIRAQKIDENGNLLWQNDGIILSSNENIVEQIFIVNDGTDGALFFWRVNDYPNKLYGTHILGDGSIATGWGTNGKLIISSFFYDIDIIADGYNGVVIAWEDVNYPIHDLYMQRVDSSGNLLWGSSGIPLCIEVNMQDNVTITTDNDGIYYFFWRDNRNGPGYDIYMQKVDQNGNKLWLEDGLVHEDAYSYEILSVMGNDNNSIICWRQFNGTHEELYTQKIDINGNILWEPCGLPICTEDYWGNTDLLIDNYGGCWVTFSKADYYPNSDIYIQHVNSEGAILLEENGMLICSAENFQWQPSVNNSINDEIYISWEDRRTGSMSIYSQVLNYDGVIQLPENGIEIFGGLSGDSRDIEILQNYDNPFLIWKDKRYFHDDQIYIQSLNIDGSTVFEEDGIPITTFTGYDQDNFDAVLYPNSNIIAIVWEEVRADFLQIFAQAIDTSGNYLWSDSTGINLTTPDHYSVNPKISIIDNSGTDEYYIGWEDWSDYMNPVIYGQKIIDGELQWGEEGKLIAALSGIDQLEDIVENFYIWKGGGWPNYDIFVKLVDENGNTAAGWPEDGLEICTAENRQTNPQGIIIPQGLLIIWEDDRSGERDIYGQIVTYDGNILWQENGLPLVVQDNDQDNFQFIYNDGLYLVWQDFRLSYNSEIYAQKFDENGNELWQEGGVLVAGVDETDCYYPDLIKVGNKIFIVWAERIYYDARNIKAQLLNEDGELLWQAQGIFICDEFMDQNHPKVVSNGEDDVYIAWQDGRATIMGYEGLVSIPGVYAQKFHIEQTSIENEVIPNTNFILSNYPNPFNPNTTISFELNTENTEDTELIIYNLKGQKVKTFDLESPSPFFADGVGYSITWDGTDDNNQPVSSGIYFYQLNINDKIVASKKCLLLK